MKKKIVAMVPVKLNSERVKGKNIRPFSDGTPLIQFILRSLLDSKYIDEMYVYCSDECITEYLIPGIRFLQRPEYLDQNTCNCNDIIREFMKTVTADLYVVAHTTAPFTRGQSIDECIEAVVDGGYDSAFLVKKIQSFLWEKEKPLNFDVDHFPRTQDLEPVYMETSGAFVFVRDVFRQYNRRVGVHVKLVEVGEVESCDIDTEEEFLIADAIYMHGKK